MCVCIGWGIRIRVKVPNFKDHTYSQMPNAAKIGMHINSIFAIVIPDQMYFAAPHPRRNNSSYSLP